MIDYAGIRMTEGQLIACERKEGMNDNMTKSHFHDFYEIYYLEEGGRNIIIEGSIYTIEPGMFAIKAPYIMHHSFGDKDVPFKRIVLYFRPNAILSATLQNAMKGITGTYRPARDQKEQFQMLLDGINQEETGNPPFKQEAMQSLLNNLLVSILRQTANKEKSSNQHLVGDVMDYIHDNYFEDITLENLAKRFYVSHYYLCREFKRMTNRTIIQYISVTRISNAQRKIMETDLSITEISNLTGFSNLTNFNRVFKKYAGISPSQYRKEYREMAAQKIR